MGRVSAIVCAAFGLLVASCGHSSDASPEPSDAGGEIKTCAEGFDVRGDLCVPRYDACDERSVPRLGGGCDRVGVPSCPTGFSEDGRGGCSPILPASPCPEGKMALPGETTCRDVAPCGTAPYGDTPVDASTVYVDPTYTGGGSDGSATKPHLTLVAAIAAAKPGATIALAAGKYESVPTIVKPLQIWGRCPSMVTIRATSGVSINVGQAAVELHRLKLEGPAVGAYFSDATGYVIDEVWVTGMNEAGIQVTRNARDTKAIVRRSLLEHAGLNALFVSGGASVTLESSVIRDTRPPDKIGGTGVRVLGDPFTALAAPVTIKNCLIERSSLAGIDAEGAALTIEGSVVRETHPESGSTALGAGINLRTDVDSKIASSFSMTDTLVEDHAVFGVSLVRVTGRIERSTIRSIRPGDVDGKVGRGIQAAYADFTMLDSLVDGSHEAGVLVFGAKATIERSIVRDTAAQKSDGRFGYGVCAMHLERPADVTLRSSLVLRSKSVGIATIASSLHLEGCAIAETLPQVSDGQFGDGLVSTGAGAKAFAIRSVVRKSARAGILVAGGDFTVEGSAITCSTFDLDAEPSADAPTSLDDRGGNACGCSGSLGPCRTASAGLAPIDVSPKPR